MDDILVLLLLLFVGGIFASFIFAIWLLVNVRRNKQKNKEIGDRLFRLEDRINKLQRRIELQTSATQSTTVAAPAPSPSTPPRPPAAAEPPAERAPESEPIPQPEARAAPPPQPEVSVPKPPPLPPSPEKAPPLPPSINWERFMGVNLFAWIGGFILFLATAFFVKYSIDQNLIGPQMRIAIGFLLGTGLLIGGLRLAKKEYMVTAQTLCATGIVILYADLFAAHSYYRFIGLYLTFLLMVLVTVAAFLLAVRLEARVVAILGLLGGFLTPPLLSTGVDRPLGLFGYIGVLDAGLLAMALRKRWPALVFLAAISTVLTQVAWAATFFAIQKVFVALAIYTAFPVLFLLCFVLTQRWRMTSNWIAASAVFLPFVTLVFSFYLLSIPELGNRPATLFAFVLAADLCLMALALREHSLHTAHRAAGAFAFFLLILWTLRYLSTGLLNWALALYSVFTLLHTFFPLLLQRLRPEAAGVWWSHLFPPLALLLLIVPIFRFQDAPFLLWLSILLIDGIAIAVAMITASIITVLSALVLTLLAAGVWILQLPVTMTPEPEFLMIIGFFAFFFFIAGLFAGRRVAAAHEATPPEGTPGIAKEWLDVQTQIPALSAILPFLLLILAVLRLPMEDPSAVFGLALLLTILLLGLTASFGIDALPAAGLAGILALEYTWHNRQFHPDGAILPLLWYLAFYLVFSVFPFTFEKKMRKRIVPWAVASLSGPLHFYLFYDLILKAYNNPYMGLVPAAFSIPPLLGLIHRLRLPPESERRNSQLAWFGGAALFFITLIFPVQFEREWITIGWGLEGLALLWLFHRIPHSGLKAVGIALLIVAFVRLTLNPAVFSYHPRSDTRIWNWYLYAYGMVTMCLMFGGRLLSRQPRSKASAYLYGLGTILAFFLMNIEIADFFAEGPTLTFQFSGNFARDMTFSIAWAVFAFVILLIGMRKRTKAPRYAGIGLLAVTLLKLFLHDLRNLNQLYRVGALLGVAVILILASYLYQRFLSMDSDSNEE